MISFYRPIAMSNSRPSIFPRIVHYEKRIYAVHVPDITSVQDMIVKSAAKFGDKIALEDLKETPIPKVTYRSLLKDILKFGVALQNLGLKERSHIAVIGENRVQWGIAYLTAMCFNQVVVPIDRNLPINEVLNIIHEADVAAIIFSETFDSVLRERRASLKKLKQYIGMDLPAAKEGFYSMRELIESNTGCRIEDLPKIIPGEEAEIIFTSGSLGRAKGVMLSQKNIASNLVAMVRMFFISPEDRFLSVLPMHHTYECTCGFLCPLYMGASAHYARSLKDGRRRSAIGKGNDALGRSAPVRQNVQTNLQNYPRKENYGDHNSSVDQSKRSCRAGWMEKF